MRDRRSRGFGEQHPWSTAACARHAWRHCLPGNGLYGKGFRNYGSAVYLAVIGGYRKLVGAATITATRVGSGACAAQGAPACFAHPRQELGLDAPGDCGRPVMVPEIKGYFRRTRVGRAWGSAADGAAALDSRAGETFHWWPSSVMTVTDFLL